MYAGSLKYDTKLDSSGFKQGLSKLGTVAGKVGKGIAVAMTTATATVGVLATQAIKAYSDYEQLVGGVKTLFKNSASLVQEYANEAYKTAGLSANEYMQQATSFSAKLIKETGGDTQKVAELVNMAITDMSDNANKMGTDMALIQNAYEGLAKGNATMLDNLKVGYGGTETEMLKLAKDMGVIDENVKSFNDISFEDSIIAIHKVQEQLGITGTTAEEASTTIQGSLKMLKASWQNLLTGIAKGGDLSPLVKNFTDSFITLGNNLLPVINNAIGGIGQLAKGLLQELLPQYLPVIVDAIYEYVPWLAETVKSVIKTVLKVLPTIITAISQLIPEIISTLLTLLPKIIDVGIKGILSVIKGISSALPQLIAMLPDIISQIVDTIIDNLDLIIDTGLQLIVALAFGIVEATPKLLEKLPALITKIVIELTKPEMLQKLISAGILLIIALIEGIVKMIPELLKVFPTIVNSAKEMLSNSIKNTDWKQIGRDIITGIKNGLINYAGELYNSLKDIAKKALKKAKDVLKIKSPSRVFADQVGQWIPKGIAVGIDANTESALKSLDEMSDEMVDRMKDAVNIETGKSSFSGLSSTVNEMISANSEFTGDINNVLTLDGEVVYENQEKIKARKNLQYGGIK